MPEPDLLLLQADEPAELNEQAVSSHEEMRKSLENDRRRAEIEDLVQNREQRKAYASGLFWIGVAWLVTIGGIVLLHGFSHVPFTLSGAVLTTLIGSTTVSVLGLLPEEVRPLPDPPDAGRPRGPLVPPARCR